MRSHRVPNFPDPTTSPREFKTRLQTNSPAFQSAETACQHLLPGGSLHSQTAPHSQAHIAAMLAFARCMRSHGFPSFPDPTSTGLVSRQMLANAGIRPAAAGGAAGRRRVRQRHPRADHQGRRGPRRRRSGRELAAHVPPNQQSADAGHDRCFGLRRATSRTDPHERARRCPVMPSAERRCSGRRLGRARLGGARTATRSRQRQLDCGRRRAGLGPQLGTDEGSHAGGHEHQHECESHSLPGHRLDPTLRGPSLLRPPGCAAAPTRPKPERSGRSRGIPLHPPRGPRL